MRYFFLIYAYLIVLVISIFGFRGDKFSKTPIRIFPDMDEMDYVSYQAEDPFFKDGMGARKPVANTVPVGHSLDQSIATELQGYGNKMTYLHTGYIDGKNYGKGLPVELNLKGNKANQIAFLTRGKEVFGYKCAVCHGKSGNGKGVVSKHGFTGIFNLRESKLPEGGIYDVLTHGRGKMGQMGSDVTLYDRWAVVAYVKLLQASDKIPAPKEDK